MYAIVLHKLNTMFSSLQLKLYDVILTLKVFALNLLGLEYKSDLKISNSPKTITLNRQSITRDFNQPTPISVNYHFTRICNYQCGFCFHTAKTSYMLDLQHAKLGLQMLKNAGMQKINFSGGEPFLPDRGRHLGEMVKFCKQDLKLPSVTIVTNGSMVKEKWFKQYGAYLDIMAVSCDSFDEDTNQVFQCLLLEGENVGAEALRNAETFYISNDVFEQYLERHKSVKCLVPESNVKMQNSYLILDEYMRFLDCREGSKIPSKSLLDVGVANALKFSGFDEAMFKKRGGIYKWSKEANKLSW